MLDFTFMIDTSALEAKIKLLNSVIRDDSVESVANTFMVELPKLYAQGLGGDGEPLPPYSVGYLRKLGGPSLGSLIHAGVESSLVGGTTKTLTRGKNRLYDLRLVGNTVTVGRGNSNARTWALGQQTGASGRWPYSNVMFGENQPIQDQAAQNLAAHIQEAIA